MIPILTALEKTGGAAKYVYTDEAGNVHKILITEEEQASHGLGHALMNRIEIIKKAIRKNA